MRKKKNRSRSDPFAFNPEKFLESDKKKGAPAIKICEVCRADVATWVITAHETREGTITKTNVCKRCHDAFLTPQHRPCRYCGVVEIPSKSIFPFGGPGDESVWCEACGREMAAFMQRPENITALQEQQSQIRKLIAAATATDSANRGTGLMEFLTKPENAALKAEYDRLMARAKSLNEDMEKHVRDCAAKRKQA